MARPAQNSSKPTPAKKSVSKTKSSLPVKKTSTKPAARSSVGGSRKAAPAPVNPGWWQSLPPERKLDILGVGLALLGFLSILSLLSENNGLLTRWWVNALRQTAGLGALILPVGLLVLGLWLILRNIERFPFPSGERLAGMVLFYLNILTILHMASGGGWDLAQQGIGGGYLGAAGEQLLVSALGPAGAVVVLAAWFLIAALLILDISFSDLMAFFSRMADSLRARLQAERQLQFDRQAGAQNNAYPPEDESEQESDPDREEEVSSALPPDFTPLLGRSVETTVTAPQREERSRPAAGDAPGGSSRTARPAAAATGAVAVAAQPAAKPAAPAWSLPAVAEILDPPTVEAAKSNVEQERGHLIETTLASFGAPAHIVEIHRGPTVTQYGVEPDFVETRGNRMRVRVGKIASLADDLALALAAPRIRIQAPVPGRSYVGIEVPNAESSRVMLREVIESENFQKIKASLRFALGKDVAGKPIAYDLSSMPHLLIAGTTGSGKSVCVNSILTSLLLFNSPMDLRMILVDPKRVELTGYNGIPHLLSPVVVEADQVVGALQWVQREMDTRYHHFSQVGARNIQEYNRKNNPPLPYLLVLIDELADLMMLSPDETERSLTRLAQLARATGIHLVLATQRPSVDVVTGLIKANFPARVAFAVASGVDSRVILDQPGAERLLGRGDMLFQAPDAAAPVRLQGVYVSDPEIQRLVDFWRTQDYNLRTNRQTPLEGQSTAVPVNLDLPLNTPLKQAPLWDEELGGRNNDPMMDEAVKLVRQEGKASISMLQRKMRIGYTRAARMIDAMEDKGIIGPAQTTSQVRAVLDDGTEE